MRSTVSGGSDHYPVDNAAAEHQRPGSCQQRRRLGHTRDAQRTHRMSRRIRHRHSGKLCGRERRDGDTELGGCRSKPGLGRPPVDGGEAGDRLLTEHGSHRGDDPLSRCSRTQPQTDRQLDSPPGRTVAAARPGQSRWLERTRWDRFVADSAIRPGCRPVCMRTRRRPLIVPAARFTRRNRHRRTRRSAARPASRSARRALHRLGLRRHRPVADRSPWLGCRQPRRRMRRHKPAADLVIRIVWRHRCGRIRPRR